MTIFVRRTYDGESNGGAAGSLSLGRTQGKVGRYSHGVLQESYVNHSTHSRTQEDIWASQTLLNQTTFAAVKNSCTPFYVSLYLVLCIFLLCFLCTIFLFVYLYDVFTVFVLLLHLFVLVLHIICNLYSCTCIPLSIYFIFIVVRFKVFSLRFNLTNKDKRI
jgi:hypothetical protein